MMDSKLLVNRRTGLIKQLKEKELIIIFAASVAKYPRNFLQDNNFKYLIGLDLPEAILVISKQKKPVMELFIERGIPEMEVWEGKKMTKEEASEISGIEKISYLDEFERKIGSYMGSSISVYTNLGYNNIDKPLNKQQDFITKAKQHFPHITASDITKIMIPLRSVKTKWEIEQIQKAINVTGEGIKNIIIKSKIGMMEYELEAILQYEVTRKGLQHMGFKPIIAAGGNAATLHYEQNNSKIGKDEMVLLDVGAACNGYSADISRTFPVSGKFTKRQKEVYSEVLKINKKIITMVKPGIGMKELNEKTIELIQKSLIKLKLIKDKKDYRKYYMHSVGHHLGMDTHDIGARDSVLKMGNVITIEPGIYIPEEKIGVRIEDDILVTKTGNKNLSKNIPKEINELENLNS
ncbi:MAG: aminopeptidase P N-terminal domain-containing protein [FCB group bacterium]|nr:aminopeptidase P N-terminal domain-containing protein [FCB group bacterium]